MMDSLVSKVSSATRSRSPRWQLSQEHTLLLSQLREQQSLHEENVRQLLREELNILTERLVCKQNDVHGESPGDLFNPQGTPVEILSDGTGGFADSFAVGSADQVNLEQASSAGNEDPRSESKNAATESSKRDTPEISAPWPTPSATSSFLPRLSKWEKDFLSQESMFRIADTPSSAGRASTYWQKVSKTVEKSRIFQFAIEVLIIANGVLLGVQQDHLARYLGEPLGPAWLAVDAVFAAVFSFELATRIFAKGLYFFSCQNKDASWNCFDGLLVVSANIEILLKVSTTRTIVDMSTGRILRMMRLVRIVRVVRVLRFFKDLRVMVLSIMCSLKPLAFALCLLASLIYVVSVFFMHFVTERLLFLKSTSGADSPEFLKLDGYYGTVPSTAYTLFLCISGGVNWGDRAAPLWEISPVLGIIFLLYISFCVFCVLNIITGIFVEEATTKTCQDEEQMLIRELEKRKRFVAEAKRFFEEADKDNSGQIAWPEFRERLQNLRMQKLLEHLGIDVNACGAENVFQMFDFDGNGTIAISEFTAGLQRLGGGARSIEIAGMRFDQQRILSEQQQVLTEVTSIQHSLKDLVQQVREDHQKAAHLFPALSHHCLPPVHTHHHVAEADSGHSKGAEDVAKQSL